MDKNVNLPGTCTGGAAGGGGTMAAEGAVPNVKSLDIREHRETCYYYRWDVTHRQGMQTEESMAERWLDFEIKNKGAAHRERFKAEIERKMKSEPVKQYFRIRAETYESFRPKMLSLCSCVGAVAQVSPPTGPTTDMDGVSGDSAVPLGVSEGIPEKVESNREVINQTGLQLSSDDENDDAESPEKPEVGVNKENEAVKNSRDPSDSDSDEDSTETLKNEDHPISVDDVGTLCLSESDSDD